MCVWGRGRGDAIYQDNSLVYQDNLLYELNKDQPTNSNVNDAQSQPQSTNVTINKSFTIDEINKHITFLKKNEIPGIDHILNEFIKYFPKFVY